MQVDKSKTVVIDPEHSIEFGQASWNAKEKSIRRRKNNPNGTYDPISSSEIPIDGYVGIGRLFLECLKIDVINKQEMTDIMNEIIESTKRQGSKITIV